MSSGLSPISLLDAAAGHVSANVIEIIKLLKIRKTVKSQNSKNNLTTRLSIDEMRRRGSSAGSVERLRDPTSPVSPGGLGMPRYTMESPLRTSSFSMAGSGNGEGEISMVRTSSDRSNGYGYPQGGGSMSRSSSNNNNPLPPPVLVNGSSSQGQGSNLLPSPMNGGITMRTNRTDSVMSNTSDAFDLDRKASVVGSRGGGLDNALSPPLGSSANGRFGGGQGQQGPPSSFTSFTSPGLPSGPVPTSNSNVKQNSSSNNSGSNNSRREAEREDPYQRERKALNSRGSGSGSGAGRRSSPKTSDLSSGQGPITPVDEEEGQRERDTRVRVVGEGDDGRQGRKEEWEDLKVSLFSRMEQNIHWSDSAKLKKPLERSLLVFFVALPICSILRSRQCHSKTPR